MHVIILQVINHESQLQVSFLWAIDGHPTDPNTRVRPKLPEFQQLLVYLLIHRELSDQGPTLFNPSSWRVFLLDQKPFWFNIFLELHESPARPSQSSQSRYLLTSCEEADRVGERTPGGQWRRRPARRVRDPSCASRSCCASADSRGWRDGSGSEGPFVASFGFVLVLLLRCSFLFPELGPPKLPHFFFICFFVFVFSRFVCFCQTWSPQNFWKMVSWGWQLTDDIGKMTEVGSKRGNGTPF